MAKTTKKPAAKKAAPKAAKAAPKKAAPAAAKPLRTNSHRSTPCSLLTAPTVSSRSGRSWEPMGPPTPQQ